MADDTTSPPIHRAVEQEDEASVAAILAADPAQARATLRIVGYGPDTPLHAAAGRGNAAIAELLLRSGADPNAVGDLGLTPLHRAANLGRTGVVEVLLRHAADPNVRAMDGGTPLHHCLPGRDPDFPRTADRLIAGGALVDLRAALGLGDTARARRILTEDSRAVADDLRAMDFLPMVVQSMTRAVERELGPLPSDEPLDRVRVVSRRAVDDHLDILDALIARRVPPQYGALALIAAVDLSDTRPAERLLAYGVPPLDPRSGQHLILPGRVNMSPIRSEYEELFRRYQYKWRL